VEQSLSRIADVMQCPLHYEGGAINGNVTIDYECLPGLTIPITVTAKKVSHNEQTSVLFQGPGHLWLLVGYYGKTRALTMFLIDSSKSEMDNVMITPDKLVSRQSTLKETVDALRPAIVHSSLWKNTRWEAFKLPK
jgi:hypothetical protein